jgi:hypothetical protein
MADFLDRYGDQLRFARVPTRRRSRAPAIGLLVILAVAAPAVAVVQPWNPTLGPSKFGGDVVIDRSPVDRSATEVLAILRRPQTAHDREVATPLLRYAGGTIDNVQVDSIRALSEHYALIPHASVRRSGAMLCVVGGGGAVCSPADGVAEHGVISISDTRVVGVVPDGVARVRFTPDGGKPVRASVRGNFFALRIPGHRPTNVITPPRGGRLEWLDADGEVVGPA